MFAPVLTGDVLALGSSVHPHRTVQFCGASSNGDLFDLLAEHEITDVRKNWHWGKALMARAIESSVVGDGHPAAGTTRQVVEAVNVILRIRSVGFLRSLARERVDPVTGRAVARKTVGGAAKT
jgi:hypothetical protein